MAALTPASGTGAFIKSSAKVIRFVKHGCTNRPFFHIVVAEKRKDQYDPVIEQVGSYDPFPNQYNEKLVSFNFERIRHWIGKGADLSQPVAILLGLSGYYPIHPKTYMTAWRNRKSKTETQDNVNN
uniref:Small ribosomal subunit protein bS16m n=1 Tax=Xenopsylla cheopis TaxID=163159 RepID=A0A6M2DN96_XENCH